MMLGVLLALVCLWYLPTYMQNLQYAKMKGEVRAINEAMPEIGAKLGTLGNAFGLIAKKVGPSVVFIDTTATRQAEGDIFGPSIVQTEGEASGVVIDPNGFIVTNNHVVEGASEIRVSLSDNRQFAAEVVGTDAGSDLAVVKIPATGLVAASWGDSSVLDVGDWVLAIGNPYGLDRTVTFGIISAKNRRNVGNSPTQLFLQTDAAVNPGNSGGPLVNMAGEVIGINTAIIGPSYQGISFALPSNTAREVYEKLKSGQRVVRGWLGVQMGPINAAAARQLGLKSTRGALVTLVLPGSPASKAGLRPGDVIIQWDDHPVDDPNLLRLLVAGTKPGATAKATVIREGQEVPLEVSVGESPPQ
jgi:serine protease Do